MKTLVRWGRAKARQLRRWWTDWRTGTLTCYGGPLDGERRHDIIERYTVSADHRAWCAFDAQGLSRMANAWGPSWEPVGTYVRRPTRFVWRQYRTERSDVPPHPFPENRSWE